jgi:hypothetical protein
MSRPTNFSLTPPVAESATNAWDDSVAGVPTAKSNADTWKTLWLKEVDRVGKRFMKSNGRAVPVYRKNGAQNQPSSP